MNFKGPLLVSIGVNCKFEVESCINNQNLFLNFKF
jgi:hypothetical protein